MVDERIESPVQSGSLIEEPLSPALRLAIRSEIASLESERIKRVDRRIAIFSSLVGAGLFAILGAAFYYLRVAAVEQARITAIEQVTAEVNRQSIITKYADAVEQVAKARSTLEGYQFMITYTLKQADEYLKESKEIHNALMMQKDAYEQLPKIQQAIVKFNDVSGLLQQSITNSPELLNAISAKLALPKGLVVAFNRSRSAPCPIGWSVFEPLKGRFIVGVNEAGTGQLSSYSPFKDSAESAVGGQEKVTLTLQNMPKHSHRIGLAWTNDIVRQNNQYQGPINIGDQFQPPNARSAQTDAAGESIPFDIRPPFLPLFFCTNE